MSDDRRFRAQSRSVYAAADVVAVCSTFEQVGREVCVCVWSVNRYDNEYGYSTRVTDLVKFVNSKDHP